MIAYFCISSFFSTYCIFKNLNVGLGYSSITLFTEKHSFLQNAKRKREKTQ